MILLDIPMIDSHPLSFILSVINRNELYWVGFRKYGRFNRGCGYLRLLLVNRRSLPLMLNIWSSVLNSHSIRIIESLVLRLLWRQLYLISQLVLLRIFKYFLVFPQLGLNLRRTQILGVLDERFLLSFHELSLLLSHFKSIHN